MNLLIKKNLYLSLAILVCLVLSGCKKVTPEPAVTNGVANVQPVDQTAVEQTDISSTPKVEPAGVATNSDEITNAPTKPYLGKYQIFIDVLGQWQPLDDGFLILQENLLEISGTEIAVANYKFDENHIEAFDTDNKLVLRLKKSDGFWLDDLQDNLYSYKKISS